MSLYVIKFYVGGVCDAEFIGDDETVATSLFYMSKTCQFPKNFYVTKRHADNREYVLKILGGGFIWNEIALNTPTKEL